MTELNRKPSRPVRSNRRKIFIGWGVALALLGLGVAYVLSSAILPIPKPSGPHPVGFTTNTLTDSSRTMQVQGKSTARVITLDIWYPAQSTEGFKASPYTETALNKMLEKYQGIPASLNTESPSFAFQDAPALKGKHPTVIFNHGYGSFSKQNASNFQELASHGYVVLSIAHPGDSLLAQDGQGNMLEFDGQNSVYLNIQKNSKAQIPALAKRLAAQRNAQTSTKYADASHELAQSLPYTLLEPMKKLWLEDTLFLIETLSQPNKAKILETTDPAQITLMGHSFGGMIALEVAKNPPVGVQHIVNLDGPWVEYTQEETAQLQVPVLALLSTQNRLENQDLSLYGTFDSLLKRTSSGTHLLELAGTAHMNFTDLNFIPILKWFTPLLGKADNKRMATVMNRAILEFLKRDPLSAEFSSPLLRGSNDLSQRFYPAILEQSPKAL